MSNVDMRVTLAGMTMKNPVVVASGTFGFGREYSQFFDLSELGGIWAVLEDGSEIPVIGDGKFLVPGTEELNKPLT